MSVRSVLNRIAAVCILIAAFGISFATIWMRVKSFEAKDLRKVDERAYHRLWLVDEAHLVGLRLEDLAATVTAFGQSRRSRFRLEDAAQAPSGWTITSDATRLAWISSGQIMHARLFEGQKTPQTLTGSKGVKPLGVSFLPDGTAAVLSAGGHIEVWDLDLGSLISKRRLDGIEPEILLGGGRYLGAVSLSKKLALAYDTTSAGGWATVDRMEPAAEILASWISPSGNMALLTSRGVQTSQKVQSPPGKVHDLAIGINGIPFAVGGFEGVVMLASEAAATLAPAPAGTRAIAASSRKVAWSGGGGTWICDIVPVVVLTKTGMLVMYPSQLLLVLAILVLLIGNFDLIVAVVRALLKSLGKGDVEGLPKIPEELTAALAQGRVVLYAGAGLSAPAGFPLLPALARTLYEWIAEIRLFDEAARNRLRRHVQLEEYGRFLDRMVELFGPNRDLLLDTYRRLFLRRSPGWAAHELLGRMRLNAMVTTNHDVLLERMTGDRMYQLYTPVDPRLLPAVRDEHFFLLKLYGDLAMPATVSYAPSDFAAATKSQPAFVEAMRELFRRRTILFVGASMESLESDLRHFDISRTATNRHYAIVLVSGWRWQARAESLRKRYGIVALPIDVEHASRYLPALLEKMLAEVPAESEAVV